MVIDTTTGQTPPTAAERMDVYDRAMGNEPVRPARASVAAERPAPPPQQAKAQPSRAPAPDPGKTRMAAKVAETQNRPWKQAPSDRPPPKAATAPARIPDRATPPGRGRKTIVTGKWWDSKGPRTIELGPKGQQTLSGGFVTLFFVAVIATMVALFIQPVIVFVVAFLLFRFGGNIIGPLGASIVDKALAERN